MSTNAAAKREVSVLTALLALVIVGPLQARPEASGPILLSQRDVPIVITVPGSYRLASNLAVGDPNVNAIFIKADNVTIDLDGFAISGPEVGALGAGSGINSDVRNNVSVRNGTVRGFYDPAAACVHLPGYNNRIENLRVASCPQQGLFVGQAGIITGCQVSFS